MGHGAVSCLLKPERRFTESRESWRNAGATGRKGAAGKIMRIRLLNSCLLAEHVVSCALDEAGSCGGKKCHVIVFAKDCIVV